MASSGFCPICNERVPITPDRLIKEGFSARLWKVSDHELVDVTFGEQDPGTRTPPGGIIVVVRCPGSGKLI